MNEKKDDLLEGFWAGDAKLHMPQKSGVRIDADGDVHLDWGGYDYLIEGARIHSPERLLGWIVHLSEKGWKDMEPWKLARLIEKIANRKGWNIWKEPSR